MQEEMHRRTREAPKAPGEDLGFKRRPDIMVRDTAEMLADDSWREYCPKADNTLDADGVSYQAYY